MLASCHRRTGAAEAPPAAANAGTGWAGLEQPTTQRERSKQTTRTTAGQNYRGRSAMKTLVVKTEKSDQLDLHARPGAEQLVRTGLTHRHLQVPHASEVDERLVGPSIGVGGGGGNDVVVVDPHAARRRLEVSDQVAEPVDPQHTRAGVG